MGHIIYREYIVFRGSNISCSLACVSVCEVYSVTVTALAQCYSKSVQVILLHRRSGSPPCTPTPTTMSTSQFHPRVPQKCLTVSVHRSHPKLPSFSPEASINSPQNFHHSHKQTSILLSHNTVSVASLLQYHRYSHHHHTLNHRCSRLCRRCHQHLALAPPPPCIP